MREQLYMGNQLFIHHNLVQHNTLALFISLPYHDTTTLYDNPAIFYLRHLMPWYDKRERGAPLFIELHGSYGVAMYVHLLHSSIFLEFSPSLFYHTNIFLKKILHFIIKNDNYYSYLLSTLLEPSYHGMILSMHCKVSFV